MASAEDFAWDDLVHVGSVSVKHLSVRGSTEIVSSIMEEVMKLTIKDNQAEMEDYIIRNILTDDLSDGPVPPQSDPRPVTRPGKSLFRPFDPWQLELEKNGRKKSSSSRVRRGCGFCISNGEPDSVYRSHKLMEAGRVTCPHLRKLTCRLCGATGDNAHTASYCPRNSNTLSVTNMLRSTAKTSDGRVRRA